MEKKTENNQQRFESIERNIIDWAEERGIFKLSTPTKQLLKTHEEINELHCAVEDYSTEPIAIYLDEIKDAIGDILVTLIIYAKMKGIEFKDRTIIDANPYSLNDVWNDLFFSEKEFPENLVIKNIRLNDMYQYLTGIAVHYKLDVLDCLESAYNIIKDRTGKMKNGKFVKD